MVSKIKKKNKNWNIWYIVQPINPPKKRKKKKVKISL